MKQVTIEEAIDKKCVYSVDFIEHAENDIDWLYETICDGEYEAEDVDVVASEPVYIDSEEAKEYLMHRILRNIERVVEDISEDTPGDVYNMDYSGEDQDRDTYENIEEIFTSSIKESNYLEILTKNLKQKHPILYYKRLGIIGDYSYSDWIKENNDESL